MNPVASLWVKFKRAQKRLRSSLFSRNRLRCGDAMALPDVHFAL